MVEYLSQVFYGNSIKEWIVALSILLFSLLAAKIIFWIIKKWVKRITSKTKTRLDDIIVDMVEEPLVLAVVLLGMGLAFHSLSLDSYPTVQRWFSIFLHLMLAVDAGWLLSRTIDAVVGEYLTPIVERTENDLDDQMLPIARKGIKLIIWIIAVIVGLNNAGYNVSALLAGLGIGGLAFALAAQDTISNFFGGIMIFIEKPFTIRDRIKISGYDGVVEEVGIRSTRVRTLEGRALIIPNSNFTKNIIENVSSEPNRKVVLVLNLVYDTSPDDIEKALQILRQISEQTDEVEDVSLSSFVEFAASSLNVLFIYYIKFGCDILNTQTKVHLQILRQFNDAGLEFAYPTQTIITQNVKQN